MKYSRIQEQEGKIIKNVLKIGEVFKICKILAKMSQNGQKVAKGSQASFEEPTKFSEFENPA